jgi:ribosome maturation factor RimP
MKATPLEIKISKIIEPVVADMGLSLVCVRIIGEGGSQNVQVIAENPETRRLDIDSCAKLSKAISAVMDVEDPINGAYRLEVSSPGIDRILVKLEDFETYKGYEAKLETYSPIETGQKRFRGPLRGIEGNLVLITTDQGDAQIPFENITKARLVLTDELIKATAGTN